MYRNHWWWPSCVGNTSDWCWAVISPSQCMTKHYCSPAWVLLLLIMKNTSQDSNTLGHAFTTASSWLLPLCLLAVWLSDLTSNCFNEFWFYCCCWNNCTFPISFSFVIMSNPKCNLNVTVVYITVTSPKPAQSSQQFSPVLGFLDLINK